MTFFKLLLAEYFRNSRPISVEPVNETASIPSCMPIALPTRDPGPVTTFSTPSGTPASLANSAIRTAVMLVSFAALTITLFPAASAGPAFHANINIGKFQGKTHPTTPTGSRTTRARASSPEGVILSKSLSAASAYQARQWIVSFRSISAMSRTGLPLSRLSSTVSSKRSRFRRFTHRIMMSLRSEGCIRDQTPASNACRAFFTA